MIGSANSEGCADIIVVGGGGAGLAAAAEAAKLGRRVIVVEKNPLLGGSTRLAVGLLVAAGSHMQRKAGVQDSPDLHDSELAELVKTQGIIDNPELRRLLVANSADTLNFLASIGVDFLGPLDHPPFKVKRFHQALPDGRAYIYRLERLCRSLGVEILLNTRARCLLLTRGRVTGIEVELSNGNVESMFARAAVILASGDFSANRELRAKFIGQGSELIDAYNATATGDGHLMAIEIGAKLAPRPDLGPTMGTIAFPRSTQKSVILSLPPYRFLTLTMKFAMDYLPAWMVRPFVMRGALADLPIEPCLYEEGAILINRNGERFTDEVRVTGAEIARQPGGEAFIVFDDRIATLFGAWPHFVAAAPGVAYAYVEDYRKVRKDIFFRAPSVESLAYRLGVPPDRFKETVGSRNSVGLATGKALAAAPYFALGPLIVRMRHVPIGIAVDGRLQVLKETGEPIPGLFAAGDTGQAGFAGIAHGHSLAWAFTTGRLAGRNAALEPSISQHTLASKCRRANLARS